MHKTDDKLAARRSFVKRQVRDRGNNEPVAEIVEQIADDLFLSPRTIWRDLRY